MTFGGGSGPVLRRGAGLVLALALAACAKEEAPPGALPDTRPPQVARIEPGNDSVVPGFHGNLDIVFDEPIKVPTDLAQRLQGSPAYRYEVGNGFSDISIHPADGWRPGAVYVIQIPAGIPDLLGNLTPRPIQVVFSTGPAITRTSVSGTVRDRITGQIVQGARVLFRARTDSIPYTAVSDTGGRFSLPSLPTGSYEAYGFRDLNGDQRLQPRLESYDSASFTLPDSTSTAEIALRLTPPDSTPPHLLLATPSDSETVELRFDDYLDPAQDFDSVRVTVRDTLTGASWPVVEVGPETAPGASSSPLPRAVRPAPIGSGSAGSPLPAGADTTRTARPDTGGARPGRAGAAAEAGGARPDTGGVRSDTGGARSGSGSTGTTTPAAPARTAAPDTTALPVQKLLARLGRPLEPGTYRVTVAGLRNLRDLVGGGDTLFSYPVSDTSRRPGGKR